VDVQQKLTEITQVVEDARAMPMSASCLVNREEMLGLLDELRALLPEQLQQADTLLGDRDAVVQQGRDAARRLLDQARAEHDRLVEEQAVVIGARERAAVIIAEANAESTRLLSDADDYVDRKLAEFEIALDKLTQQVQRGRARLNERRAADLGRLGTGAAHSAGAHSAAAGSTGDSGGADSTADSAAAHSADAHSADAAEHERDAGREREPGPEPGSEDVADLRSSGLGDAAPLR
jgi:cell division septum initiation protein DivIVA